MNILRTITSVFTTDHTVLFECRRCGTSVTSETDLCPYCELGHIARYEIR